MNRYFENNTDLCSRTKRIVVFRDGSDLGQCHFSDGSMGCTWSMEDMEHVYVLGDTEQPMFTEITLPDAMLIIPNIMQLK